MSWFLFAEFWLYIYYQFLWLKWSLNDIVTFKMTIKVISTQYKMLEGSGFWHLVQVYLNSLAGVHTLRAASFLVWHLLRPDHQGSTWDICRANHVAHTAFKFIRLKCPTKRVEICVNLQNSANLHAPTLAICSWTSIVMTIVVETIYCLPLLQL